MVRIWRVPDVAAAAGSSKESSSMKCVAFSIAACVAGWATVQQPVFRSGVDSVTVDVAVLDGDRLVDGLTASDFEVRDNGVRQNVIDVAKDKFPITLELLLDVSASSYHGLPRHWSDGPLSEWIT